MKRKYCIVIKGYWSANIHFPLYKFNIIQGESEYRPYHSLIDNDVIFKEIEKFYENPKVDSVQVTTMEEEEDGTFYETAWWHNKGKMRAMLKYHLQKDIWLAFSGHEKIKGMLTEIKDNSFNVQLSQGSDIHSVEFLYSDVATDKHMLLDGELDMRANSYWKIYKQN